MNILKRALLFAAAGFLAGCIGWKPANLAGTSAGAALIPREVLFGNPVKAAPQLSPNGKQLAYLAPVNGVMNIWVRTLGQADDHNVTSDTHRGIPGFQWQYDNRHLLYGQDTDGDENARIYQLDTATAQVRCLTPWRGVQAGVLAQNWRHPGEALITGNLRNPKCIDVYRADLDSGTLSTDTLNAGNVLGWNVDENLEVHGAAVALPDGGMELFLRRSQGEPFAPWQRWGPAESGGLVGFSPGGNYAYLNSSVGSNTVRLLLVNLETSQSQVIAANPQIDVGAILFEPRTHVPVAVQYFGARREWTLLDQRYAGDFAFLKKQHAGDINIASQTLDNKLWIVQYVLDDGPQYYYLYDRTAQRATLLFADRPALEKYRLAPMQPIAFKARDGMELNGYLSLPKWQADAAARPPLIIEVHGGPWGRDVWGYNASTQWLANRGYAVLKINFRASVGFGKAYTNAGDREWGAKMQDDLIDGKRWAIAQGLCDPARVAIMGGSYGGYATLAGLAFTPEEFACGVDVVGPSNLVTLLRTIPPYWEPEKASFYQRVGRDETFLQARSPLYKADQIKAPLLIAQGANDPRVKQAESDQIVNAIRKRGGAVEYLLFPDEGHGFVRPVNRLKYYATAEEFLAKHLGGRQEQAGSAEPGADTEKP